MGEFLDRIGDVRNDLNGGAKILAATFLGDDVLINPPRSDIVRLTRRNPGEALVVAQIEIGFRAIVGHIDFAVLIGAHRSGIDVEIGIELADSHAIASRLQQRRKACCHKTFAERGDHAAGYENVPRHGS